MNIDFIKNMSKEKKIFLTFLAIHFIVWSCVGLIRTVLPTDSLEGIFWGSLHDFGTPKHPPMAAWITYLSYIPFKIDYSIYFISQLFILFGFIYIYKLAKCFLNDSKSMLAVIVMEGCWSYSYITGYYGFNPDVVFLFTLPAITYYFYKCMNEEKASNWLKLGLIVGFSFLNKYQTATLIFPMLIYALIYKRNIFKNIWFYISIVIAFFMFLPHLLWLIKYDFFPFLYFSQELSSDSWVGHITCTLLFILLQLAVIVGVLVIFGATKLRFKSPIKISDQINKPDSTFILLMGVFPILFHVVMIFIGGAMRPRWGYEFWFMIGIILFYFIKTEITEKEFKFTTKMAYIVMLIVFLSLGTLLTVEKNYRSRYPVAVVYNDMKSIWEQKYNTPIKYIGGYIEWTLPLTIYVDSHPTTILDTFGYKSPWLDEEDMKKSGVLIINREDYDVAKYVHAACPYLPDDYEINPTEYKFTVYNALGMPREYTIYYFIVPPEDVK